MYEMPEDRSFLADLDDGVLSVTFNRPDAGNALPTEAVPLLTALFERARGDALVGCILVRGSGKVFSAGGDVANFARTLALPAAERQAQFRARLGRAGALAKAVIAFDRPLVVAMRGAAAGAGLLYPLAADVAIGDDSASFVFAHQRVGLSPDAGVSYLLPRVVGARQARNLFLTTARLDAQQALAQGILTQIVAADALDEASVKIARGLARAAAVAVRNAKMLANAAESMSLDDHLQAETDAIVDCVGSPDFAEGVTALLEKRAPRFGG